MFKINVEYKNARLTEFEKLTSGSSGVQLEFEFSPEWRGLLKTVCFENGVDLLPSVTLQGRSVDIPLEAMKRPGVQLKAGVYGEGEDGHIVIPTVYATLGYICRGAEKTGLPPEPPTPDWTAGIELKVNRALEAAESVERRADAGEFKGRDGAGLDISGAKPGQVAKVRAVDEKGVPTSWEAADVSGGADFSTDGSLSFTGGVLRVNTAERVEMNNNLPVSSSAVYAELGSIEALLRKI